MLNEKAIQEMLVAVESDERLRRKGASLFSNAPVAIIQTELMVRANTLREVLELPRRKYFGED